MSPLKQIQVPQGTVIVREGEQQACAYRVVAGSVGVYKETSDQQVPLARLETGQFFGEMSLVLDAPRTASVVALTDCVLDVISAEHFNDLLFHRPSTILPLLRVLFERLRLMNVRYASLAAERYGAAMEHIPAAYSDTPIRRPTRPPNVRLAGASELTTRIVGARGQEVDTFPFRIGRRPPAGHSESDVLSLNDLVLVDGAPFQVSRNHCAIDLAPGGGLVIADRGSARGTAVNGARIGAGAGRNEAPLQTGSNEIVLGSDDSRFRFVITVDDT